MLRAIDKWGWGYLQSIGRRPRSVDGTRHLIVCVADHFEPYRDGATDEVALQRLKPWCDNYMKEVDSFRDADGRTPQHTFFYPQEEYNERCLDMLGDLCGKGAGEVEIHLHHRNDTADGLKEKLVTFRDMLHKQHGMLGIRRDKRHETRDEGLVSSQKETKDTNEERRIAFGFVHGNWALCNARPDGDWCGVNEELSVLAECGCYADFTFPSAPSPTQPRMVNAIYRAKDIPGKPRGCDYGERVHVCPPMNQLLRHGTGQAPTQTVCAVATESVGCINTDEERKYPISNFQSPISNLMLIQGPLGLNWKSRKYGLLPRLENAEISGANSPTCDRVDLWAKQGIHVQGRPEWSFIKLHTHGCVPENMNVFLKPLQVAGSTLHECLQRKYNDGVSWKLHYVTAREMYNIARAAEDGNAGSPGDYRDYEVCSPSFLEG